MKKIILSYGLIAGLIVSTSMIVGMNYLSHCSGQVDYSTSMIVGYTSMLVAFSMIFVGIRSYRENHLGGVIRFWQACKVGIAIAAIASTMYVITWQIDYYFFIPDFMDKYSAHMLDEMRTHGASAQEIERKTKEMASFAIQYKNPFFNAMMTYMEILPLGVLVTLICSFILKSKKTSTI